MDTMHVENSLENTERIQAKLGGHEVSAKYVHQPTNKRKKMSEHLQIVSKERKRYKEIYIDSDTSGLNWRLEKCQMTHKQERDLQIGIGVQKSNFCFGVI